MTSSTSSETASLFPPPPSYYKRYTDDAYRRPRRPNDAGVTEEETEERLAPPRPPPPGQDTYRMFGADYSIKNDTPVFPVRQLFPDGEINHAEVLKNLNMSLLFGFLDLVDTLVENPVDYPQKVEHIHLVFNNFYHVLNTYRPHEARETLKLMLQEQLDRRRECTLTLRRATEKARRDVAEIARLHQTAVSASDRDSEQFQSSSCT